MAGWGVALDEASPRPFQAMALGKPVTVRAFDADTHHGIRCEIQGEGIGRRWIGVDTLDVESLPEGVQEAMEAFEVWSEGDY